MQARYLDHPLFTDDNRLLLLLSLLDLSDEQQQFARMLVARVTDWDTFFNTAARNHSLPLVARNLRALGWPQAAISHQAEVQAAVADQALHNLTMLSGLRDCVASLIQPSTSKFVIVKGLTMNHQYYPDLGLRPCRDIDIAVEPDKIEPLVRAGLRQGYQVFAPNGKGGPLTVERDITSLLKYAKSAMLLSPQGLAIDLQPGIDKHSGIFDAFDIFQHPQHAQIGGNSYPVLEPNFLFNYLCHHHARHLWSRLHWLSDLDAMMRAPQVDLRQVATLADQFGHRGTIDAAIAFHRLVATPQHWDVNGDSHGYAFLRLCLRNLAGDLRLEKSLAVGLIGGEFMFRWQADDHVRQKARRNWVRTIMTPSFHQYQQLPLPASLQWVYYPSRFMQLTADTLRRRFGPTQG